MAQSILATKHFVYRVWRFNNVKLTRKPRANRCYLIDRRGHMGLASRPTGLSTSAVENRKTLNITQRKLPTGLLLSK